MKFVVLREDDYTLF